MFSFAPRSYFHLYNVFGVGNPYEFTENVVRIKCR